jgi:hypothetical protein
VPVVALVSAKGSPGVTTAAVALTAAAQGPEASRVGAVLVELDPSGGDLEVLTGAHSGEPSLLAATADVRRRVGGEVLAGHAVEVAAGVRALVAPTPATVAGRAVESVGGRLATELAEATGWVLVDAGRWDPAQPTVDRLQDAEVVGVVCRSTAPSIAHAREVVPALRSRCPRVAVMLVGDTPYRRAEVAAAFDVPVLGPLAWDMRGVSALWARGATPRWLTRTALGRSARAVLGELDELVDGIGPGHAGVDGAGTAGAQTEAEGEEVVR